jgi:general nucleoside transport system permease protein
MSAETITLPVDGIAVADRHPVRVLIEGERTRALARVVVAVLAAMVMFGLVMLLKGVNPITAYREMFGSTFRDWSSAGSILIKAAPIMLAGLAVAIPARAGLINVGGEGQLVIGGVAAMGVSLAVDGALPGTATLVLMATAAMVAGAAWSAIAVALRVGVGISESVSTLLMNYLALDLMFFLIYDRWKDPNGSGQPATRALEVEERLPVIGDSRVHVGIVIALIAAGVLWWLLKATRLGFRLRVVGGNAEAARRAAVPVGKLLLTAMAMGGALAGLGGLVQLAGAEFKLRPGFLVTYGYIGFLAAWLARHKPLGVVGASLLLATISIGGDSLQIDSQLPAASINVLMALTLLVVFGFGAKRKASA